MDMIRRAMPDDHYPVEDKGDRLTNESLEDKRDKEDIDGKDTKEEEKGKEMEEEEEEWKWEGIIFGYWDMRGVG